MDIKVNTSPSLCNNNKNFYKIETNTNVNLVNDNSGCIYILYNEVYNYYGDNVYKIGKTKDIYKRLSAYTTSYIKPCEIKFISLNCNDYSKAEMLIFNRLKKYRIINNREFFKSLFSIGSPT